MPDTGGGAKGATYVLWILPVPLKRLPLKIDL
jgi:hypothetical protein